MKLRALTNPLITGYTVKGDCPTTLGGNLCCIQATDPVTPEEFVAYIGRVYDLAAPEILKIQSSISVRKAGFSSDMRAYSLRVMVAEVAFPTREARLLTSNEAVACA
jgi:hypothetical protein